MPAFKDRRKAQAGFTMVEVLVSLVIASLALALAVGTISTGLLNASLAKRNTAVQAVMQYEMEQLNATPVATSYSDCFATESPNSPAAAAAYQGACPAGPYTLRADVNLQSRSGSTSLWTISVITWPNSTRSIASIQLYTDH